MNIFSVAIMYMVVSCCTFVIQMWKFWSLLYQGPDVRNSNQTHFHRGLVRTSVCRVLVAFVYVTVGIYTLHSESIMTEFSLWVFGGIQLIWILNAFADVKLWNFISYKIDGATMDSLETTESTTTRSGDIKE